MASERDYMTMAKAKTPPKGADTGPVRRKRTSKRPIRGNPTKAGKIFGNPHKRVKGRTPGGNK